MMYVPATARRRAGPSAQARGGARLEVGRAPGPPRAERQLGEGRGPGAILATAGRGRRAAILQLGLAEVAAAVPPLRCLPAAAGRAARPSPSAPQTTRSRRSVWTVVRHFSFRCRK